MSWNPEDVIEGMPRRPRIADASASAILWAIAGGLLAGPPGALIGAATGGAWANQRQPLEMAVRDWLTQRGLELIFFYPAPRAVKLTFRDASKAYWTVESVIPDDRPYTTSDDVADWLYGDLVANELPLVLPRIRRAS